MLYIFIIQHGGAVIHGYSGSDIGNAEMDGDARGGQHEGSKIVPVWFVRRLHSSLCAGLDHLRT